MKPLEQLNLIHQLELKWRETHNSHTEKHLLRNVDQFLGTVCIPTMYQWVKYTKMRHKGPCEESINSRLQEILEAAVKADTLDEKIIAIERCMNAHHFTNYFPDHLKEIGEAKRTAYQRYYDGDEEYEISESES